MCPEVLACIVDIKYIFLSDLNESPVYALMWFEETLGGEKSLYFEKIKSFICTKPLWNLMFCHAHWHVWVLSVVCLSHASFNFSNKYDYVYNPKLPEISLSLHSWRNGWGTAYLETDLQDYVQKKSLWRNQIMQQLLLSCSSTSCAAIQ